MIEPDETNVQPTLGANFDSSGVIHASAETNREENGRLSRATKESVASLKGQRDSGRANRFKTCLVVDNRQGKLPRKEGHGDLSSIGFVVLRESRKLSRILPRDSECVLFDFTHSLLATFSFSCVYVSIYMAPVKRKKDKRKAVGLRVRRMRRVQAIFTLRHLLGFR